MLCLASYWRCVAVQPVPRPRTAACGPPTRLRDLGRGCAPRRSARAREFIQFTQGLNSRPSAQKEGPIPLRHAGPKLEMDHELAQRRVALRWGGPR
jgi:hypothetical protein